MRFDLLAKHSPASGEKYAALLLDLTQEFENRFQAFWENNQYFAIFVTLFFKIHFFIVLKFYLFIFREAKGGRKGGREPSMSGCLSCAPYLGT